MSGLNLEQTGRTIEESLRQVPFDPAELLRRKAVTPPPAPPSIDTEPPRNDPPPVSQVPAALPPSPAPGQTQIPQSLVKEIRSGENVQYAVRIPQGVEDLASFVEAQILQHLKLDGTHPPASQSNGANPAAELDDYDDAALIAELAAWIEWKRGGPGTEPTIPLAWRGTMQRIWDNADITRLIFESRNGVLLVKGLTSAEYQAVYGIPAPGENVPAIVGSIPNEAEAPVITGINPPLYNIPIPTTATGGPPMTMVVAGAASAGRSLWPWIKTVGITAAVSYLTQQLVEQGVDPTTAAKQAEMAVEEARPRGRRRRKRMLTCQDKEDIQFIIGVLGKGEMGKTAVAALLAGCRR